jgi:hypothetical protein
MRGRTALTLRKARLGPHARKRVALEVGACIPGGDGGAQLVYFPRVAALSGLERLLTRTKDVFDAREMPGSDLGLGETREVFR